MERVGAIQDHKRKRGGAISFEKCIICQKGGKEVVRQSSEQGIKTLNEALATRIKYNCDKYLDTLDRLQRMEADIGELKLVWHKNCFSSFTSSSHLERLGKRHEAVITRLDSPIPSTSSTQSTDEPVKTSTRRVVPAVYWEKCVYCQGDSTDNLRQVLTLETSKKMMLGAQSDSILRCRLAGISDLVAAEAKYHLKCFVTFFRKLKKSEASTCDSSVFNQSDIELETGVKAGYIFSVKGVWDRYCELVGTSETPSRDFDSNVLREFRNQLTLALGDRIEFVASARKRDSLLIIPAVSKETIVRTLKGCCDDKDTKEAEGLLLQTFAATNDDEDLFRSIYHVGSRVRMDMKAATGHITYDGIDKANVEAIVPESLFLLVSMLLGENDNEDHRDRILSIAQDIIYASSKGRKVTPKHIGLAIAIHHATRSKNLINVFHAAGHCVSYEFVQRIDTSIAKSELDRYKKNNSVVVPSNLVPGDFVQFAADNINILEETLDGKGQFNGTQCAAFQVVGDSNVVPSNETSVIGKDRFLTSSIQPDFHELLPSNYTSSARPSPVLPVVKLDWYKISDTNEAITEA